jgi:hypothetical protein
MLMQSVSEKSEAKDRPLSRALKGAYLEGTGHLRESKCKLPRKAAKPPFSSRSAPQWPLFMSPP